MSNTNLTVTRTARETLNSMTPPDKLTDDQLFAFEYAKHTTPSLMKKTEMSNTKKYYKHKCWR